MRQMKYSMLVWLVLLRSWFPAKDDQCCGNTPLIHSLPIQRPTAEGPACHFSWPSSSLEAVGKINVGPMPHKKRLFNLAADNSDSNEDRHFQMFDLARDQFQSLRYPRWAEKRHNHYGFNFENRSQQNRNIAGFG
jgi:hypothetical protein